MTCVHVYALAGAGVIPPLVGFGNYRHASTMIQRDIYAQAREILQPTIVLAEFISKVCSRGENA